MFKTRERNLRQSRIQRAAQFTDNNRKSASLSALCRLYSWKKLPWKLSWHPKQKCHSPLCVSRALFVLSVSPPITLIQSENKDGSNCFLNMPHGSFHLCRWGVTLQQHVPALWEKSEIYDNNSAVKPEAKTYRAVWMMFFFLNCQRWKQPPH